MTTFTDSDYHFMRRALQLAKAGRGHVSPNPMVGAVIVDPAGRIIGEGWHRRFGGPHAEVNAVRSVSEADRMLLGASTIYVTLEPCSHYGKTPPCAKLLVECGIGRVVIAAGDPNPKVSGRGVAMLKQAGIRVDEGLLAQEAWELNRPFMTAHSLHRPFVTLKWAQSADGYMARIVGGEKAPVRFSTSISSQLVHVRRANHDAIAVGAGTVLADNPRLDVRLIEGRSPIPVIFDRHKLINAENCGIYSKCIHITDGRPLEDVLGSLYAEKGISSVLVEGGASLLREFVDAGLWDEAYVETSAIVLGDKGATPAPQLFPARQKGAVIDHGIVYGEGGNRVNFYSHKADGGVKNI